MRNKSFHLVIISPEGKFSNRSVDDINISINSVSGYSGSFSSKIKNTESKKKRKKGEEMKKEKNTVSGEQKEKKEKKKKKKKKKIQFVVSI